jgi:uncharacterized peroxidase-related enzyme
MSFIETIEPDAAEGAVAAMYRGQQAAWGYVPNYARPFSHRPVLMERWAALAAEAQRPLGTRLYELATFVAAHALRNSACALAHGGKLRQFYSDAEVIAIARGRLAGVLDAKEQALVAFARRVAIDASAITQADVDTLRACGWSDAEVFDIAVAAAVRAFFTKVLDAMGVQMDAPFLRWPEALQQALVVGRPIDPAPVTRIAAETADAR